MNCQQKPDAMNNLLFINTRKPNINESGPAKPMGKGDKKEEKRTFTTTITTENDRRLANYQANKRGGARTTDVVNEALKRFFDANKQYADVDLVNFK